MSFMHSVLTMLRRLTRGQRDQLQATYALGEAIKQMDAPAVRAALDRGANVNSCSYDLDSFHTPLELAIRGGNKEIVEMLRERSRRGLGA